MSLQVLRIPFERITTNDTPDTINLFNFKDLKEVPDAIESLSASGQTKLTGCIISQSNCVQTQKGIIPLRAVVSGTPPLTVPASLPSVTQVVYLAGQAITVVAQATASNTIACQSIAGASPLFTTAALGYSPTILGVVVLDAATSDIGVLFANPASPNVVLLVRTINTTPVTLLTLASAFTSCAVIGSRLVITDKDVVYWSADGNYVDFTPSAITGAGSGSPAALTGTITAIEQCSYGFYLAATGCAMVASANKGDVNYPFIFSSIPRCPGGLYLSSSPDHSRGFLSGATGIWALEATKAEPVYFNVWDAAVNGSYPDDPAVVAYTPSGGVNVPKIRLFMGRYLFVQTVGQTACWIVDIHDGFISSAEGMIDYDYSKQAVSGYLYFNQSSGVSPEGSIYYINYSKSQSYLVSAGDKQLSGASDPVTLILGRFKIDGYHSFRIVKVKFLGYGVGQAAVSSPGELTLSCFAADGDGSQLVQSTTYVDASGNLTFPVMFECPGTLKLELSGFAFLDKQVVLTGVELTLNPSTGRM